MYAAYVVHSTSNTSLRKKCLHEIVDRPLSPVMYTNQMRRVFAKFDEHRELWAGVVRCVAHLDALLSLTDVSGLPGFSRPHLYEGPSIPSFIRFTNARHPCLAQTYQGGEYIPNHGILGTAPIGIEVDGAQIAPNMLLLTGPNMGGKSTLLRQTCLAVILAQVSFDAILGM